MIRHPSNTLIKLLLAVIVIQFYSDLLVHVVLPLQSALIRIAVSVFGELSIFVLLLLATLAQLEDGVEGLRGRDLGVVALAVQYQAAGLDSGWRGWCRGHGSSWVLLVLSFTFVQVLLVDATSYGALSICVVVDGEWLLVGGHSAIQEKASLLLELRPIASVPQDLYVILALPCNIER